jgi:hypothetical protein
MWVALFSAYFIIFCNVPLVIVLPLPVVKQLSKAVRSHSVSISFFTADKSISFPHLRCDRFGPGHLLWTDWEGVYCKKEYGIIISSSVPQSSSLTCEQLNSPLSSKLKLKASFDRKKTYTMASTAKNRAATARRIMDTI